MIAIRYLAMREFNSRDLDTLDFDSVCGALCSGRSGIVLEKVARLPEADVLCCRYKGRKFNVKFDSSYGVCIEATSDFSVDELEGIARILAG